MKRSETVEDLIFVTFHTIAFAMFNFVSLPTAEWPLRSRLLIEDAGLRMA